MTLVKYNPRTYRPTSFSGLLDRFFDDTFQGGLQMDFTPSVDIAETEKAFEIQVQLPGVKSSDVEISVENDQLTISGERKFENTTNDKSYHSRESYYGKFSRSFRLPDAINAEKITAKQEDGILVVTLPKDEKKTAKKQIKIG
jgi:HSP20 family protein